MKIQIFTSNIVILGLYDLIKANEREFMCYRDDKDFFIVKGSIENDNFGNHLASGNFLVKKNKLTEIRLVYNGYEKVLAGYDPDDKTVYFTFKIKEEIRSLDIGKWMVTLYITNNTEEESYFRII